MTIYKKQKLYRFSLYMTGIIQMIASCFLVARGFERAKGLGRYITVMEKTDMAEDVKMKLATSSQWDALSKFFLIIGIICIIRAICLVLYANYYNDYKPIHPIRNYLIFGDPFLHLPAMLIGVNAKYI